MKLKLAAFFVLVLCILLVIDLGSANFRFLNYSLAEFDSESYAICKNLVSSPIVARNKDIQFFVSFNPLLWLYTGISSANVNKKSLFEGFNEIRFGPLAMKQEDFEIMAAWSIGYIEHCCDASYEAEVFVLRLLGNKKRGLFIKSRKRFGDSEEYINRILQKFDTEYGQEKAGFGISIIPLGLCNAHFLGICKEIEARSYATGYSIGFVIDPGLKEMASSGWKDGKPVISFHPFILAWDETLLKVLAAHEIGHVVLNTHDQLAADAFAAKIVGKETVKKVLLDLGLTNNHPRILALSE